MPRRKRSSSPYELFDDDLDDDSQSSRNGNPPIQRNAANARERARMRVLSSAFGRLKTKLPNIPPDTKLSKLDTLRLATMYIKQLRALAEGNSTTINGDSISPMQFVEHGSGGDSGIFSMSNAAHNLSWPFGLHHIQNPTNRQLSYHHQCSSMDWNQATSTDQTKCPRLHSNNDTYGSQQSSSPSFSPWYPAQNSNPISNVHHFHNNSFNLCNNNSNQITQQNTQISHTYNTNSTYHQNAMSPIR